MACDILAGIAKRCKDSIGGIKKFYVFPHVDDPFTISSGQATAINSDVTAVFEFVVEGDNNNFEQAVVTDRNNKTTVNTQNVNAVFGKMDTATNATLNLLVYGYHDVVVEDRNGVHHALGIDDGFDFNVTATSGGAKGDLNGYTLAGTSQTGALAPTLDSSTITALLALLP